MAVDLSKIRSNYVAGLQDAAKKALALKNSLDSLTLLYTGAAVGATFADPELSADVTTKHLTAADVATITGNLAAVNAAITPAIANNLAKCVGGVS